MEKRDIINGDIREGGLNESESLSLLIEDNNDTGSRGDETIGSWKV